MIDDDRTPDRAGVADGDRSIAIADVVEHYLERRAADDGGSGAGAYAGSILRRWAAWLERERDVTTTGGLEAGHLDAYARALADRVERGEYAAGTARTYYAVVRSFCSWCVEAAVLDANPAAAVDVAAIVPDGDASGGSSAADAREAVVAHARERAATARGEDRLEALREYALVAVLAYAGLRGSELCRVPGDDRRTGATWDDVDFYAGRIRVLGPAGHEAVPLPAPARRPLRRYRVVLDPPSTEWPLFPTRHAPSIATRVRTALRERGYDEGELEAAFEGTTAAELARERVVAPPAITTEGARSILKRLSETAPIEGDHLTPRGVRGGRERAGRDPATTRPALSRPRVERTLAPLSNVRPVEDVVPVRDARRATADRGSNGD